MLKLLDGQDSLPDTFVDFFFERSSAIEGARPYSGMRIRDGEPVLGYSAHNRRTYKTSVCTVFYRAPYIHGAKC